MQQRALHLCQAFEALLLLYYLVRVGTAMQPDFEEGTPEGGVELDALEAEASESAASSLRLSSTFIL